ncbi:ankyrin repeat-containing domain protein [Infundibulicybe gibba]|nr:ankyrin repeat-containing domain protein [Infundibulicybe gibba]KAF8879625.1 ankyrin repeat-containing domain protein [Infundibulicybe gibba]
MTRSNLIPRPTTTTTTAMQAQANSDVTTPDPTPAQSNGNNSKLDAASLPPETLAFAHKIFDAARNGDTDLVIAAVDAGLPLNLTNEKGNTLLMLSAYAGHLPLVQALLTRSADVNSMNDNGQSIIAGAVFKGYADIVTALAKAGADPRRGRPSAVEAAHMFHRTEMMEVLGTRDEDRDVEVPPTIPTIGPGAKLGV